MILFFVKFFLLSFKKDYFNKLFGILGSSTYQAKHALVPAPADREPIQLNNLANILIPPNYIYSILTISNIIILIVIIWQLKHPIN